jgi:hypothetical protein
VQVQPVTTNIDQPAGRCDRRHVAIITTARATDS